MALCQVCRDALRTFNDPKKRVYSFWYWLLWLGGKYDDIRVVHHKPRPVSFLQRLWTLFKAGTPSHLVGHHRTFESYQQSYHDGCVACTELLGVDEVDANPVIARKGYFSLCTLAGPKGVTDEPRFLIFYGDEMDGPPLTPWKGEKWPVLRRLVLKRLPSYRVWNADPCLGVDDLLNIDISPSTEDQQAWSMVQKWLGDCLSSHQTCDASVDTSFMPSRVLEVSDCSPGGMEFRLVTRDNVQQGTRYVTLSYCWGGPPSDENFILTRANFKSLSSWQPVSRLPKTFRDAFEITRRLGMRYLWIDRFCILQDSVEDWKAEAASMRDVYGNTFLNIAALSAGNDDGGCFFERDPLDVSPGLVWLRRGRATKPCVLQLEYTDGWRYSFSHEILLERSWVVQERLLSPRVVYFGRKQIFWECREVNCCETHPTSVFVQMTTGHDGEAVFEENPVRGEQCRWKQLSDTYLTQLDSDPVQQAFAEWRMIVGHYAGCRLTVASDRLVALSAVSQDMRLLLRQKGLDSRYCAGIWAYEMPFGLLWQTTGETSAGRLPEYRAPSWSWVSVDVKVIAANGAGLSPLTKVIDAVINLADEGNEVGQVTGGYLRLEGKLLRATLEDTPCEETEMNERWRYIAKLDHPDEPGREIMQLADEFRWNYINSDVADDMPNEFLVLPVGMEWRQNPREKCWAVKSLALDLHEDEHGRFRRLGYVELNIESRVQLDAVLGVVERRRIELI